MKYKFLFIILIFSLITSCVKDYPIEPKPLPPPPKGQPAPLPAKPYRTVFVSDSLKGYGQFKVGSYWIFRDSITSLTDSVYVNSITSYFITLDYTIDSLPIFGNTFYNARHISYAHSFYGHSTGIIWIFGDVYWKKNIGIIKYHNYPTSPLYHPYELIRYNVIQ